MNVKRISDILGITGKPQISPGESIVHTAVDTAEAKLDEEYISHLAAIVEFSEDAIISKSLDGTIKSWNKGSEKMFGYTSEEVIGKNISLIIPPEFIKEDKSILVRISNNKKVYPYETIRLKKNGEQLYVSLAVSPLKDWEGNIIGASTIGRNITAGKKAEAALIIANKELVYQNKEKHNRAEELLIANKELVFQNEEKNKRAEELLAANKELVFQNEEKNKRAKELLIANKELAFQDEEKEKRAEELIKINAELKQVEASLKEVNKELEAFTYSVSHDLRAPLRAVNSYSQILIEDYGEVIEADGRQVLENICYNTKKMGALIDELLLFSRLGRKEIDRTEIDMNELIQTVLEDINRTIENRATIQVSLMPVVKADHVLLQQVLFNLISNAVKYSSKKEHSQVEIFTEQQNDKTVFAIKDNGAGFDMRFANKLFGVFQRLHSEKEFEGNGVGLAIVQRIIAKHGGKAWAQGKENEGATFYFTLN